MRLKTLFINSLRSPIVMPKVYNHYPEIACFNGDLLPPTHNRGSVMQRARDGKFYRWFFKKSSDDRNEPLDCEVYANAAEQIFRPDYEKLSAEYMIVGTVVEHPVVDAGENPDRNFLPPRQRFSRADRMDGWIPKGLADLGIEPNPTLIFRALQ